MNGVIQGQQLKNGQKVILKSNFMIHFLFSNKSPQYLFLKADTKEDEKVINELKSKMNLTDPVCYLKSFTGIPFTQDFLYEYVQK